MKPTSSLWQNAPVSLRFTQSSFASRPKPFARFVRWLANGHIDGQRRNQLLRGDPFSFEAFGDTVADGLVDVAPILERACQYGIRHTLLEVADDVGDQPIALGVVHDLAHQGARLTEVIVVLSLRVSGMDELSA